MHNQAQETSNWRTECERVSIDFANAIDRDDFDTVLSLFTDDGMLDRMGDVSRGQAELRDWIMTQRPAQTIRHICSNFSGELLESGLVHGTTYFTVYRAMGKPSLPIKGTQPLMIGDWADEFRLVDGYWRIQSKSVKVVFQSAG